ncbi:MAG TPA: hypothetical protein VF746_30385 [Longimicrobium sp.]|jgi:hypothetical protein
MQDLLSALESVLRDPYDRILAESILGTADPARIRDEVDAFCRRELGAAVAGCRLFEMSVGAGFGLVLADGRAVFLKAHHPDVSLDALSAMSAVQAGLARGGFPCPAVLHPPSRLGRGAATVEAFADCGRQRDAHEPAVRDAMAEALAELIARTGRMRSPGGIPRGEPDAAALWPRPHNALFDFSRDESGAAWIDGIARRARATLAAGPRREVVGHADWSAKHFRFEGGRVCVIYDWDSLRREDECVLLGFAAATFPATWDLDVRLTPAPEESLAFVRAYERARESPFSPRELRRVSAAATYMIAYTARCEHAADPEGERGFREALARAADSDYVPLD